jgi:endonuclease YncB( thermonuclease family)
MDKYKKISIVLGLILLALIVIIFATRETEYVRTTCGGFQVIDGDTIVKDGIKYRLSWIDTPEIGDRKADEAKQFTCDFLKRGDIAIGTYGYDNYGRTLAEVKSSDISLNRQLIYSCLAEPYWADTTKEIKNVYNLICNK